MARLPFLPIIAARRNFQPVYVRDLASAIAMAALDPDRFGTKTYEIGGPQMMSMTELHRAILEITDQDPEIISVPDAIVSLVARFGVPPEALVDPRSVAYASTRQCAFGWLETGLGAFGLEPDSPPCNGDNPTNGFGDFEGAENFPDGDLI